MSFEQGQEYDVRLPRAASEFDQDTQDLSKAA